MEAVSSGEARVRATILVVPVSRPDIMRPRLLGAAAAVAAAFLGMSAACRGGPGESPGGRPNLVIILGDDVGRNDLGPYGHPTIRTPHLDRLAKGGLLFESAFLTTSSCSPTRCSLLTGRYPHSAGAPDAQDHLPADQVGF